MIDKKNIIYMVLLIVGLGLIVFSLFSNTGSISDGELPASVSPTTSPSSKSDSTVSPSPVASYPNIVNKYPPAECVISGSIEYVKPDLYESKEAKITYKNVDSKARHIIWSVSPNENLSVGPNLFARLSIPEGSENISVNLPSNPSAKNYILTAQITYGVFVMGNQEIKTVSCSGQVPVSLKY